MPKYEKPTKKDDSVDIEFSYDGAKGYNRACEDWERYHAQEVLRARIEELQLFCAGINGKDFKRSMERIATLTAQLED